MKEKIINVLLSATTWMPDTVIVDKIGARSLSNVRIHLNELGRDGVAVSRGRDDAGFRITEWKYRDREVGEHVPPRANAKAFKPPRPMSAIDECAAWRSAAATVGAETPEQLSNYLKGKTQ